MPADGGDDGRRWTDGSDYEDGGDDGIQHPSKRRRTETSDGAQTCGTAPGLLLYLLIEPGPGQVPVELPADATVAALRAAAHDAGAGPPALQVLSIGAHELTEPDDTPLSDTLVTSEAVVAVRTAARRGSVVSFNGTHALVLLEGGAVLQHNVMHGGETKLLTDLGTVTSVCCTDCYGFAVADGTVRVWSLENLWERSDEEEVEEMLLPLRGKHVVAAAVASEKAAYVLVAAVASEGYLHYWGPVPVACFLPDELQGRVADVRIDYHEVVLTREGDVFVKVGLDEWQQQPLGGRAAVHIDAGGDHYTVVLDDGSVLCFGCRSSCWRCRADERCCHCNVPSDLRDAVYCCSFEGGCAAWRADGSICWWGHFGRMLASGPIAEAGCVAVASDGCRAFAVTRTGEVVIWKEVAEEEKPEWRPIDLHGYRAMCK
eukprot:TRINITY_DN1391_c0_g1_i12.p1 TRINITY_DN1391_c0_g1~~TRINITY_DN1391_c0_g1_i12.p1  ORF type:complete len:464 (+),score=94.48 TRINITY_DN1391_c0_g1_i12:105-1394(+)